MKPHPKIRKTIKWGGAVVTVLLVVVWIGSGWWGAEYTTRQGKLRAMWTWSDMDPVSALYNWLVVLCDLRNLSARHAFGLEFPLRSRRHAGRLVCPDTALDSDRDVPFDHSLYF